MTSPGFFDDRPVALTVAGSDCSCGAGIQADLKTFAALDVYGLTAVTCVVSEIPGKVEAIEVLPASFLSSQVELLCSAFPVAAIKTGMLFSGAHVHAFVESLKTISFEGPLVVDPVMVATSGDALIETGAIETYVTSLFPRATLITPNLDEAGLLLQTKLRVEADLQPAAIELARRYGTAVLVKGGHLQGSESVDVLGLPSGECRRYSGPAVEGVHTHGTGCTFSAAITAGLAQGAELFEAISAAKAYVFETIARALRWNSSTGPLHALNHSLP